MGAFVCPRCGNKDPRFLGVRNGKTYCRKCISFRGEEAEDKKLAPKNVRLALRYPLSKDQKELSDKVIANFHDGIDTLVHAVCGSGKTEISYGIIAECMAKGMHVGFALPRRDVVIELYYRMKEAFPDNRIVCVFGGHHRRLEGDLILLTTHQLYRYPHYFDLLVMDEIDAFPFKGNELLIAMYRRSLRGHCVMMSATPSSNVLKDFHGEGKMTLELHTRFHKKPIPVPKVVKKFGPLKYAYLIQKLKQYQKEKKPCFVFVPTVEKSEALFRAISPFVKGGNYVSSQRENRPGIIEAFKKGKYRFLITTAVLERGVTVKGIQVIIFGADQAIYDSAALIQISGRVGRKIGAETGDVIFLCDKETKAMQKAIREIKYSNTFL